MIAPGDYDIGSPADALGRESDEIRHRVRLSRPVAILEREVTRGEFEASGITNLDIAQYSPTADHPMVAPSWYDSVQCCRCLTERAGFSESDQPYADPATLDKTAFPLDGDTCFPKNWPLNMETHGFRLPTEAEWEIAARGGMSSTFGFGADASLLDRYGWFLDNSNRQTHVAKELRPNLRGLFDMHCSAYEWCHDWYAGYGAGTLLEDPFGAKTGSDRVYRGGSWSDVAAYCRTAYRGTDAPTVRSIISALRVALVPFEQSK